MKCLKCNYDGIMNDDKCPKCGFNSNDRSLFENEMKKCVEEAEILLRERKQAEEARPLLDQKSASNSGTGNAMTANQSALLGAVVLTIIIFLFPNSISSPLFWVIFVVGTLITAVLKSEEKAARDSKLKPASHNPKCPTCGSERIEKISTAEKIIFSGPFFPLYKTFKCSSCGYKW
jgi:transposase-like protein